MKNQAPADVHRTAPHSVEAEQGAIGSMMLSPIEGVAIAMGKVNGEYFHVPAHRAIFEVLADLWRENKATNLITFTQELRDRNLLDSLGGDSYIANLWTFVPTSANIDYYLDIVRDKYILREIIGCCTEAVRKAYEQQDELWPWKDEEEEGPGILQEFQSRAIEIGRLAEKKSSLQPISKFIEPALKRITTSFHNRGRPTGIPTGFKDLDRIMNGFEAPLTYYFAARPAMGKSSLMLAFAEHLTISAAEKDRKKVCVFSLEMTATMLAQRIICSRANIELKNLRDGFMDHEACDHWLCPVCGDVFTAKPKFEEHLKKSHGDDWPRPIEAHRRIGRSTETAKDLDMDRILIDETSDLTIMQFRLRARQAVIQHKCDLILIDYLQRMKGSGKRRNRDSRELEISEIAQGISATAKELNVPIVVLAQLNRGPESRKDGLPELGDLRESGSLEQEARFVGLLWRPWYYAKGGARKEKMIKALKKQWEDTEFDNDDVYQEFAVCIVAKQNEGPVGHVPLRFVKEFARYEPEDPSRPLFSKKPEERQKKVVDLDDPIIAEAKEIFNATESGNGADA